jgi:hypothetical protein
MCEMCKARRTRVVHVMNHPGYPGVLRCGGVCAARMALGAA